MLRAVYGVLADGPSWNWALCTEGDTAFSDEMEKLDRSEMMEFTYSVKEGSEEIPIGTHVFSSFEGSRWELYDKWENGDDRADIWRQTGIFDLNKIQKGL